MLFPALSLLTVIASLYDRLRHKKYSSPVFIPFIGPIVLSWWAIVSEKSYFLIPLLWVADIGTLAFLAMSPRLIRDWWQVSPFTRMLTLSGSKDIQTAIITLHSTGHYLLKKAWKRPPGEFGIAGLGETGTFVCVDGQYELTSHLGLHRILRKASEEEYAVLEDQTQRADLQNYSLNGWLLKVRQVGAR